MKTFWVFWDITQHLLEPWSLVFSIKEKKTHIICENSSQFISLIISVFTVGVFPSLCVKALSESWSLCPRLQILNTDVENSSSLPSELKTLLHKNPTVLRRLHFHKYLETWFKPSSIFLPPKLDSLTPQSVFSPLKATKPSYNIKIKPHNPSAVSLNAPG